MSMNFYIEGFETWQTPTMITNMLMVNSAGTILPEITGSDALLSIRMYTEWVKGSMNGVWESEEHEMRKKVLDCHLEELDHFLSNCLYQDLVVYRI